MLSLVPWMVTTAAAQDLPRAAQLIYSYKGPVSATFLRVGDECFAPLSSLKSFGWRSTLSGKEASIEAEGRILRLVVTQFNHQPMVPMRAAAEQLGAGCNWQKNKDTFEIWGSVRFATANDGEISVTSTLDAQPKLFLLSNPSRIVVDFKGARLDPNAKVELGALSRVAQFSDDTLRVVVETGSRPELNSDKASRNFTLKWDEAPAEPWTIELFDLYLLSDEKTLLFEDLVFKAD